jgi:S-adenosylmethionine-dependent methyltransferase
VKARAVLTEGVTPRSPVRSAVVWAVLREALDGLARRTGRPLDVVDLGGGTGGFAVPLAGLGHRVTVVDPSPDALAALERRAAEARPGQPVRAVQGDLTTACDVVEPGSADAVLCHGVLEFADDPQQGARTARDLLRPSGLVSVLALNRTAAVLTRVLGGRVDEALAALRDPSGRFGPQDPVPHRFGESDLRGLLEAQGLSVLAVHGVRTFADLLPPSAADSTAAADLEALEAEAAVLPEYRSMAARLHLLAVRGPGG